MKRHVIDPDWQEKLRANKWGYISSPLNIALILENDDAIRHVIAKNEFTEAVEKVQVPPWGGELGEWKDLDDNRLGMWIEERYGFSPRPAELQMAVVEVADRNRIHPPREWLDSLQWDGIKRLGSWMHDLLGSEDTEYVRLVGIKFLVMSVARIFEPGCKADNVPIFEGPQGARKSSMLRVLGGSWFTDAPLKIGDKEAYLLMLGSWIIEVAELDALSKAEASASKAFFGASENHYRPWYARRAVKVKRQCIFAGTVNETQYLKDDTGGRRYWPVRVAKIDIPGLEIVRDQLFAEAVAAFRAGVHWWVTEAERPLFEEQQEERFVGDVYADLINEYLNSPEGATRSEFSTRHFLEHAIKLDRGRWTRAEESRVGRCVAKIGLTKQRASRPDANGDRPWLYVRPAKKAEAMSDINEIDIPF